MIVFTLKSSPMMRYSVAECTGCRHHYSDVIMGAIASQITSLTIVYSTVYSGADQRKHQSSPSLAFVTGDRWIQMASNAENISIWWRHHVSTASGAVCDGGGFAGFGYALASGWNLWNVIHLHCTFRHPLSYANVLVNVFVLCHDVIV